MRNQIVAGRSYICFNGEWTGECEERNKTYKFHKWYSADGFFRTDNGRIFSFGPDKADIDWSNPLNQEESEDTSRMSDKPYATLPKRDSDGLNWIVKEYYGNGTKGSMTFDNRADAYAYWSSDWFVNCDTI